MNTYVRHYVMEGLLATPLTLAALTQGITASELDARPDPERFALREVICHLADWEPIWLGRLQRIVTEDQPLMENIDEGAMAITNRYAEQDFAEQLVRFTEGRTALVAYLRSLEPEQWERIGRHNLWKTITVDGFAALILGHDGYHVRQFASP